METITLNWELDAKHLHAHLKCGETFYGSIPLNRPDKHDPTKVIGKDNKNVLRDILSRHPNWSWEDHAIIIPFTYKLIRNDLQECAHYYFNYCSEHIQNLKTNATFSRTDRDHLSNQLKAIHFMIRTSSKFMIEGQLTQNAVNEFELHKIKASVGQKMSRVVNKWADGCQGLKDLPKYNKLYAGLSDALSPLEVKRNSILSIHPVDFLLMSYGNSWKSCHLITEKENKEYKSGPLSYLQDDVSMIFFTVGDGEDEDIHRSARITRQMYHYFQGRMIQSRLYPDHRNKALSTNYRNIVQATIAECLGIPNLWEYTNDRSKIVEHTTQPSGSTHYRDYHNEYNQYMMTVKGIQCADQITIGSVPHCIECGEDNTNPIILSCCKQTKCNSCGQYLPWKETRRFSSYQYCPKCIWKCVDCEQEFPKRNSSYKAVQPDGSVQLVCDSCANRRYFNCHKCGLMHRLDTQMSIYDIDGGRHKVCPKCSEGAVRCPDCNKYHFPNAIIKEGICMQCAKTRKRRQEEAEARERQRIRQEQEAKEREAQIKLEEEKFIKRIPEGMRPRDKCLACPGKYDCTNLQWIPLT